MGAFRRSELVALTVELVDDVPAVRRATERVDTSTGSPKYVFTESRPDGPPVARVAELAGQ
jgi:hypothetical protein